MTWKHLLFVVVGLVATATEADAACSSYPYTLTNGQPADATQVMADFNCAALTSGATLTNATQIGIGMAPTYPLDVEGGPAPGATIARFDAVTTGPAGLRVSYDTVTEGWIGYANFAVQFPSPTVADFGIGSRGRAGLDTGGSSYPLLLALSGGSVGIGIATPSYTLHVNGSVAGTSAYNNLSDVRLKKNIEPLGNGLALVSQLRPVRFEWRSEGEREVGKEFKLPAGKQVGFIAQDLAKVLPEAVSTAKGKDAIMSVAESKVVPVLVSAVQELKAANDNQALEITRLETQVAMLQHKLGMQSAQR